jgi:hypothetical protein
MIDTRQWRARLLRNGRWVLERIGVVGLVGSALVALGLVLALYAIPLARDADDLHATGEETRGRLDAARERDLARLAPQHAVQLQQWLPTVDHVNADVSLIFDAAKKTGVPIPKGEYALSAADGSPLRRFEIVLPVKERYGTVKAFVAEVLNTLPHASLAELRVERSAVNVDVLDARIRFTLFYRTP